MIGGGTSTRISNNTVPLVGAFWWESLLLSELGDEAPIDPSRFYPDRLSQTDDHQTHRQNHPHPRTPHQTHRLKI